MMYRDRLTGLDKELLTRVDAAHREILWLRDASAADLLKLATDQLGLKPLVNVAKNLTAVELGDLPRAKLLELLEGPFDAGTSTADDLADQVQLCRAFADPRRVTDSVAALVESKVKNFPRTAGDLRVGTNAGDVLDPFILAANYELLSERDLRKTIEYTASHKVLMKIEDLLGHLHENVVGHMRGNFRIPEPQGSRDDGKELINAKRNPFPGADVGQVPVPERPDALRLFQVKSKTGSAKGGDGKRLGEQLAVLEKAYGADTFYVAVVGNTLRGHRSRGAVERYAPNTAIMVGGAALNELTQSAVGAELLLRTYQRAFRAAAEKTGYRFSELVLAMAEDFDREAEEGGTDFLSAWLAKAVGGAAEEQDSRREVRAKRGRRGSVIPS
jgi:hypothetical protein